jgi:predicted ArsR family transcriptional regulator
MPVRADMKGHVETNGGRESSSLLKFVDCRMGKTEQDPNSPMLLQVFQDLIKPQWRSVLEELKHSGGLPVSELSKRVGGSYMAVKQHCEELKQAGYLDRSRIPRTVVGRPEIFYSLGVKADLLFPEVGTGFTLELLALLKAQYGDNAPDKLFFQFFQQQQEKWQGLISKELSVAEKLAKLVSLRNREGCSARVEEDSGKLSMAEFHNPLLRIFERYPRGVAMELRMIEQLLGVRVTRRELSGGRTGQPRVIFEVS